VAKEVPVLPAPAPTPVRSPIAERLQGTVKTRLATKAPVPEPQQESMSILNTISESYRDRNQRVLHDSATPTKQADTDEGKLAREGGVNHVHMLFKAAVSNSKPISDYSYRDVAALPLQERSKWLGPNGAYAQELEALRARGVFGDLQELPKGRRAIGNQWVHAEKSDGCLKARLVAQGFSQVEGIDYDAVFSPIVRFETVRIMLALASIEDWYITGLDVRNAYLYGVLDEEIYMKQPEGFKIKGQEHKVYRLKRALYGLKQAGLVWWRTLAKSMVEDLGFTPLLSDAGVYIYKGKKGNYVIAIVYVDDALFFGPDKAFVNKMKAKFMKKWDCRDLGKPDEFLGICIRRVGQRIEIDQCAYLDKLLERCNMTNAKPASTPLPAGFMPAPWTGPVDEALCAHYQMVIGSLLFLTLGSRPDIAFAVTKLSQFSANPSPAHNKAADHILHYLAGTCKYCIVYDGAKGHGLLAFADSDWDSDPNDRKLQSGYILKLADGLVTWTSRAQKTVALSSTEAEYMSISDCSRQIAWVCNLLSEIGYPMTTPTPLYGDNQGSIFIASNPVTERRSKHIDIRFHYIRQEIERKHLQVFFVDGASNTADLFTKNLPRDKFEKFRADLGLEFY
jgi:hypothetical protein